MHETEFLVATDGSSEDNTMLFGWKISTAKGTPIATNAGPAFGQALLFSAEAYKVLFCNVFFTSSSAIHPVITTSKFQSVP
eukprot:7512310-Ditylum_brightwellii.AAC.1